MNNELINTAVLAAAFLALFAMGEIMFHFLKIKVELTRKFVHFGTGLLTLLFPVYLNSHWYVLFLCSSFAIILYLSLRFDLLKSINAIERKSWGSLLYPLSVYLLFLNYSELLVENKPQIAMLYFYLPVLTLAICDPLAALFGKTWPKGKFKIGKGHKTLMGCSAFFVSSFALSFGAFYFYDSQQTYFLLPLVWSLSIAFGATLVEAVSGRGIDNFTIPAIVLLILLIQS